MGARSLSDLQRFLAQTVRRTRALREDSEVDPSGIDQVVTPGRLGMTSVERLDVYREQFWFRHWASLAEDFPTVAWLLGGRARFDALTTEYLTAVPPGTWNLQRLGEGLPRYLASASLGQGDAVLVDAARLDWAYVHAFDAADAAAFDARVLASAPDDALPRATIGFQPSLQILSLGYAVHATRREVVGGGTPARPGGAPVCIAIWRDAAHSLREVEVEPASFDLWTALSEGRRLGDACEWLASRLPPEAAAALEANVGQWFQEWTARAWVISVSVDASP